MYLNNRGWGLRTMIMLVCILFIALLIVYVLVTGASNKFGSTYNRYDETYESKENTLRKAAIKYQEEKYDSVDLYDSSVSLETLIKFDYIGQIIDNETRNNCNGYVLITVSRDTASYKPYINCDNYKTNGYDDNY